MLKPIILILALTGCAGELRPYVSDGCTLFNGVTKAHNDIWLPCCEDHDYAYWLGGTYEQRCEADLALQKCAAATGNPEIAKLMLAGVRAGGSPYLPTPYRWGYGWPYLSFRWYKAVNE